ncbi:hypothetical protein J5N97_005175 [Dioscorea zingiberensis]|uniref:Uncharacterized protein n=1 Tax=Dioscorea zingiberensis TaxID=325984 RepID=A0A9D5D8K6_9LILI|nr:hypothetical protein J5N97_005175 [Dioscorea zingiberensis]
MASTEATAVIAAACGGGTHILVFPYPAQGHMLPLLDLTRQLSLHHGLSITIATTPKNLPLLSPLLSSSPSIQPLILPFPSHPSIPPGIETCKELPSYFIPMTHVLSFLHDPLLHWFRSQPNPPLPSSPTSFSVGLNALPPNSASPRRLLPSGALALSTIHFLWRTMSKNPNPDDDGFPITFHGIPGSPTFPWYQTSSFYRSFKEGDPVSDSIRDGFLGNMASWGFVFNTFDDLEGSYLRHVREDLGHERVWAVGPLSASSTRAEEEAPTELIRWLDTCEEGTVVYVCFGSQATLTWEQAEALGTGLERSGARFVWCVRATSAVPDEGFERRVKGRGVVVRGWAPQVALLSHRAVGSFLTHCGWNSVLEAVVAGVVMLTWPMGADQFINARLLKEVGVAVGMSEGSNSVPYPDELARVVAESVDPSRNQRKRALELREKALKAVKQGGSSFRDLEGFVQALRKPSQENNNIYILRE